MQRRTFVQSVIAGTVLGATGMQSAAAVEPDDLSFQTEQAVTGTAAHDVTLTASSDTLRVEGVVPVKNSCGTVRLTDVQTFDSGGDTDYVVEVQRQYPDQSCNPVVSYVPYSFEVPKQQSDDDEITIIHRDENGSKQLERKLAQNQYLDLSFTVRQGDTDGNAQETATLQPQGSTITASGTILGENGCTTASLEDVYLYGDTLVCNVETDVLRNDPDGQVCTQQVVPLEYDMDLDLSFAPYRVQVVHNNEYVVADRYNA